MAELLVVIAVIAVLLSLVFPSMRSARASADQTICQNNLRQIAMGLQNYITASGGQFPDKYKGSMYGWIGTSGSTPGYSDANAMGADDRTMNALVEQRTFGPLDPVEWARCPVDRGMYIDVPEYDLRGASYTSNTLHYDGALGMSHPAMTHSDGITGKEFTEIKSPARFITFAENPVFGAVWWSRSQWNSYPPARMYWHGDEMMWNCAFADGHVAYTRIEQGVRTTNTYTTIATH